jgi:AraC-like DNA-binding protein
MKLHAIAIALVVGVAARSLLLTGDSVKKVALDLGFKQTSHFCRQFKFYNDLTPSEYVTGYRKWEKCRPQITTEN